MEDSHGRIGVDVEVFGPYTMPGKLFEYGHRPRFNGAVGTQANSICPAGRHVQPQHPHRRRQRLACGDRLHDGLCGYDNAFYVTAGHDESSTWQEFGEMLWTTRRRSRPSSGLPEPRTARS